MQNQNVEGQYKTMAIIWFALFSSQIMFLVILFVVKPELYRFDFSKSLSGENPLFVIIFAVLGISTLLLSFVLRNTFIKQAIEKQQTALVQTALIVGCALCEATSLFGWVLAFTLNYQYFFLWFTLGILGTILHFPKRDNLTAANYKA